MAVVTKTISWPGSQFTGSCNSKTFSPTLTDLASRDQVRKYCLPCKLIVPVTDIPLYVSVGRFCTGFDGRAPLKVMVIGVSIRHVLDPAINEPFTSIPRVFNSIPAVTSPKIRDDVVGMVITPSNSETVLVMSTLLLAGKVTACPAVGTKPEDHVLAACQSSKPCAKWGQFDLADDKFGTFGLGMTIRSEYPEAMYGPAGRFPTGGTGTTGRTGVGTGATGRTGVGAGATGRTGVGTGAIGRSGACTGTGGVTGGFTGAVGTGFGHIPHLHPFRAIFESWHF
jgi:hypothetical protein